VFRSSLEEACNAITNVRDGNYSSYKRGSPYDRPSRGARGGSMGGGMGFRRGGGNIKGLMGRCFLCL